MYPVIDIFLNIYDDLVKSPSSDPWYCCTCIDLAVDNVCPRQSSSLNCICFNARSLFPKHFTLLAYLSAVDADVVAITETFLDESILNSIFYSQIMLFFVKIEIDTVVEL